MTKIISGHGGLIQAYCSENNVRIISLKKYKETLTSPVLFGDKPTYGIKFTRFPDLTKIPGDFVAICSKVDKRTKAYKAAIAAGIEHCDFALPSPWETAKIEDLVLTVCQIYGVTLAPSEVAAIAQSCGTNVSEIIYVVKTAPYVDISELVTAQADFSLNIPVYYAERKYAKLAEAIEQARENHPLQTIAIIKSVFKLYNYVLAGCGESFFKAIKLHPYRLKIIRNQVRSVKCSEFLEVFVKVLHLEMDIKRGLPVDKAYDQLLLILTNG